MGAATFIGAVSDISAADRLIVISIGNTELGLSDCKGLAACASYLFPSFSVPVPSTTSSLILSICIMYVWRSLTACA